MTRRALMALAPGLLLRGQAPERVNYRHYSRCLPDYLSSLAADARARREAAMKRLTTAAAIEARQKWARDTFWKLNGGELEPTPLNVRTTGSFERDGYRVEKLVYESRPGLVVVANLYRPTTGKPPYPGVLFQMGHSENGKAAVPYQKCCQGLARLGYMVLAFDPIGQGERLYYPSRYDPDTQHTMTACQMMLVGDTATRAMTWDAIRSLDVLAAHPDVDPMRLASTGQSGGGTLTQFLACVDSRLAAAVVSSGNTENFACANFNPPGSTDDGEQDFVWSGRVGFDRWDLLYPFAPKPLLIAVSARDFFGTYSSNYLDDGRAEFARLAAVYEKLGHKDRIGWKETPLRHSLSYALRLEVYNWFERWLKKSDRVIAEEPPVNPEKDQTLWCGESGNVVRDFASKSPVAFSRDRLKAAPTPVSAAKLLELSPVRTPRIALLARVPSESVDIEAVEVPSDPGVFLPAWIFVPRPHKTGGTAVLLLDARGRLAGTEEGGTCQQLAASGFQVCAADLRGNGDLSPDMGRDNPSYARNHANEENYAWASLILGRPLLAQRVADILALVAALSTRADRIVICANGKMTVPALFAAAIEPRVAKALLAGGLTSYRSLLEGDTYTHPLANFLPEVLLHTDLPEIAASAAPRPIEMKGEDSWTVEAIRAFARW